MLCSACGVSITNGNRFCPACGATVGDDCFSSRNVARAIGASGGAGALVGRVIEDKYRLEATLGAGGMGRVYSATRLFIGDMVAVKILHPELISDEQSAERFRREVQAAARLKHPNAVSVYDFGITPDGLVYLVMELVEGESLRAIIKKQGPLPITTAVEIIRQVCVALDEAHSRNVVHRDVKPDNVIVQETSHGLRIKVLNFGIARMRDIAPNMNSLMQTDMMVGTPHYMSPEQCLGEEVDRRSDVYSTGVMLYEMLAGTVPFNSSTPTAVAVQHATQTPPPLRSINMSVTAPVEAVILHALAKRRESRPSSAGALAEQLIEAMHGGTLLRQNDPAAPFINATMTSTPSSAANSGTMQRLVLDSTSRPSNTSRATTAAPPANKRRLSPWFGGATIGVLVAGSAFVFFLGDGKGVSEVDRTANDGGSRSVSNVNLQQSSTPQTGKVATPLPVIEKPRAETVEQPTVDAAAVERGVRASLEGWVATTRAHDFDAHMSFYADTLSTYYNRSNVSAATSVRSDRSRTFARYTRLNAQLSKIVVTPGASGRTASATFDKTWNFEGEGHSSGAVRQIITLENIGGRWLITGEKDLQVYYVNK